MPSISDKLKNLGVQIGTSNVVPPSKSTSRQRLLDVLDGSWEKTRCGDCFIIRKTIPLIEIQKSRKFASILDLNIFSNLPNLEYITSVSRENILYIDTETTGLSGGAGTYVFIIGAAKVISNNIEFAQFFLQDPSSEASQLSALEDFVAGIELIISYNGKSFDIPRIKTRYSFHGWQSPFSDIMHIDLLHLARRLWKNHLPSCTLGDLEHYVLGITRSSLDIPGWQVSEKFFEYLQTGDPEPLLGVLYHNEIDVLSLISLLHYISDRLANPLYVDYKDQEDLVSIGEYLVHFDENQAIKVLSTALDNSSLRTENKISGLYSLAKLYKRRSNYELAVPLWKECANCMDPRSNIELAMYFEHKESDFAEAIHWTLSALEIYKSQPESFRPTNKEAAEHRLKRLIRKAK